MWSRGTARSISPPQSDQAWNLSAIQAASPDGLSVSANASVPGRVPWMSA